MKRLIILIIMCIIFILSCDDEKKLEKGFYRFGDFDIKMEMTEPKIERDGFLVIRGYDVIYTIRNNGNSVRYMSIEVPCYYKDKYVGKNSDVLLDGEILGQNREIKKKFFYNNLTGETQTNGSYYLLDKQDKVNMEDFKNFGCRLGEGIVNY